MPKGKKGNRNLNGKRRSKLRAARRQRRAARRAERRAEVETHEFTDRVDVTQEALIKKFQHDIRGMNSRGNGLVNSTENPSVAIQARSSVQYYKGLMTGPVNYSLRRGWGLQIQDDNFVAWALIFQSQALYLLSQGGTIEVGSVPYWFNLIAQGVIKTSVQFWGGAISYAMLITDGDVTDDQFVKIGPPAYNRSLDFGIKTGAEINGLYNIVGPITGYTVEAGIRATQSMWLFMQTNMKGHHLDKNHKMVPVNQVNCMTNDASAFAFSSPSPGVGFQGCGGGWFRESFLEVPIRTPLFSTFCPAEQVLLTNRAKREYKLGAGDLLTLGGGLVSMFDDVAMHFKTAPVIAYYDIDEFINCFALAICQAIQIRLNEPETQEIVLSNASYYDDVLRYPLTFQDFKILVRGLLMPHFHNYMCQGTAPRSVTGPSDNELVVLHEDVATVALPLSSQPLVPRLFAANVQCARSRTLETPGHKNDKYVVSCLGRYQNFDLNENQYRVEIEVNGETITWPCFQDSGTQIEIDIVDGSTGTVKCAISDPKALMDLAQLHNPYMQANSNYYRRLMTCSVDDGYRALYVGGMITHWITAGQELDWKDQHMITQRKKVTKEILTRYKPSELGSNPYRRNKKLREIRSKETKKYAKGHGPKAISAFDERNIIAYTSQYEVYSSDFDSIQQYFITPINSLNQATGQSDNTGFFVISGLTREPYQLNTGIGSTGFVKMSARHENFATAMVRQKLSEPLAWEKILDALDEGGNGAILGKIGEIMSSPIGHAGLDLAGGALGSLGQVIGI